MVGLERFEMDTGGEKGGETLGETLREYMLIGKEGSAVVLVEYAIDAL